MELIVTSIVAFASTNVDDIFILILFFANKEYEGQDVFIGQYLGIATLVAISFVGSLIGLFIDRRYVGLLRLLPIFFGIRSILQLNEKKKRITRTDSTIKKLRQIKYCP